MEFSVGVNQCKCYLFRWMHSDKVIISDIDGTITKSDLLGHVFAMVGKDWTQSGVAELFTKIDRNGYKFLYLSARAISQSQSTRDYLSKIKQGGEKMPDGPVLLNPTSVMAALHREVIKRQPEHFKIACLTEIKELFPENPFYAGYGNRVNVCRCFCGFLISFFDFKMLSSMLDCFLFFTLFQKQIGRMGLQRCWHCRQSHFYNQLKGTIETWIKRNIPLNISKYDLRC